MVALVVAEEDAFVRAQREMFPSFEVRLGVLFSGKSLESAAVIVWKRGCFMVE